MPVFEFTKLAEFDLEDIHDQIAHHNPAAALRLLDEIERRCELLSEYPKSGRTRDELFPEMRSAAVGSHIIFYKIATSGILVIRVFHCSREIDRFFEPGAFSDEVL